MLGMGLDKDSISCYTSYVKTTPPTMKASNIMTKKKKPLDSEKSLLHQRMHCPLRRWLYAKDSLRRQLVNLKSQLNEMQSNITALDYLHDHSVFDDSQLKTKKKKKKNKQLSDDKNVGDGA